ncbi:hypothetical protein M885DRAFT_68500 [Pelagophyceae sp. CCMP2097]|nr:hypothetical protein M885DRAFT_68500 [Pelagophyceae sp. CCMP2097]
MDNGPNTKMGPVHRRAVPSKLAVATSAPSGEDAQPWTLCSWTACLQEACGTFSNAVQPDPSALCRPRRPETRFAKPRGWARKGRSLADEVLETSRVDEVIETSRADAARPPRPRRRTRVAGPPRGPRDGHAADARWPRAHRNAKRHASRICLSHANDHLAPGSAAAAGPPRNARGGPQRVRETTGKQ